VAKACLVREYLQLLPHCAQPSEHFKLLQRIQYLRALRPVCVPPTIYRTASSGEGLHTAEVLQQQLREALSWQVGEGFNLCVECLNMEAELIHQLRHIAFRTFVSKPRGEDEDDALVDDNDDNSSGVACDLSDSSGDRLADDCAEGVEGSEFEAEQAASGANPCGEPSDVLTVREHVRSVPRRLIVLRVDSRLYSSCLWSLMTQHRRCLLSLISLSGSTRSGYER
jgi:hypothetical protein